MTDFCWNNPQWATELLPVTTCYHDRGQLCTAAVCHLKIGRLLPGKNLRYRGQIVNASRNVVFKRSGYDTYIVVQLVPVRRKPVPETDSTRLINPITISNLNRSLVGGQVTVPLLLVTAIVHGPSLCFCYPSYFRLLSSRRVGPSGRTKRHPSVSPSSPRSRLPNRLFGNSGDC
jgi:hypothetical protein